MKLSRGYAIPPGSKQDSGFEIILKNLLSLEMTKTKKGRFCIIGNAMAEILR